MRAVNMYIDAFDHALFIEKNALLLLVSTNCKKRSMVFL